LKGVVYYFISSAFLHKESTLRFIIAEASLVKILLLLLSQQANKQANKETNINPL